MGGILARKVGGILARGESWREGIHKFCQSRFFGGPHFAKNMTFPTGKDGFMIGVDNFRKKSCTIFFFEKSVFRASFPPPCPVIKKQTISYFDN
jgi:hypothetical protein